jgi:hypothetical protein
MDPSSNKITLYTIVSELNTPETFLASDAIQVRKGCCRPSEAERFDSILSSLVIHETRKNSIRQRYLELVRTFEDRACRFTVMFYLGHLIITVGSLIVPGLLTVQYTATVDSSSQNQIFWLTWAVSLLVTTFNAVLVMFKVDKRYYSLHTTLERLRSEGWQYLELTGRYSGALTHHVASPTHDNQYRFFCHYVEKIKLRQIEDEYYKYDDTNNAMAHAPYQQVQGPKQNEVLYPPSLSKDIDTLAKNVPQTVSEVMQGLLVPKREGLDSLDKDVNNIVIQ